MFPLMVQGLPPITGLYWGNAAVLTITPAIAFYGLYSAQWRWETASFAILYYIFTMLGITAGYHRLWSHRAYNASCALQILLLCAGTSAVQGSCYWWSRRHRSHHRYVDTDKDPYNSQNGLFWTHIGWTIFKTSLRPGTADCKDLQNDRLLQWQHERYVPLAAFFGYILPTVVPGIWFNDWLGGLCFSGALRLTLAHHSTFCINSVAHWLGSTPYDDVNSPRDHFLSAILTMGEGYHNFHHQFPTDYRNTFLWYQYDPAKWFIAICHELGSASHLRTFPSNEIKKGKLIMQLKELKMLQDEIIWPLDDAELPGITWDTLQEEAKNKPLILIAGYIHDVSALLDQHPGGRQSLEANFGKDMTSAFFGGVYKHSNAAHNLLSTMRVGILLDGVHKPRVIPPGQKLYIAERRNSKGN